MHKLNFGSGVKPLGKALRGGIGKNLFPPCVRMLMCSPLSTEN